jgi:hypothetical protein
MLLTSLHLWYVFIQYIEYDQLYYLNYDCDLGYHLDECVNKELKIRQQSDLTEMKLCKLDYDSSSSYYGSPYRCSSYDGCNDIIELLMWHPLTTFHKLNKLEMIIIDIDFENGYGKKLIKDLSECSRLREISFDRTNFNEPIDLLCNLTRLETLEFGTYLNQSLESLTKLPKLRSLRLRHPLSPSHFATLKSLNLTELLLTTDINQPLDEIGELTNLTSLRLGFDFNGSIEFMKKLTNLKKIEFGYMFDQPIDDVFENLTKLESIHCKHEFDQPLDVLSKLTNLNELLLWTNPSHSLECLTRLTNLQTFNVGDGSEKIEILPQLTSLTNLILGWYFNEPLNSLETLTNLRELTLNNNFNQPLDSLKLFTKLETLHIGTGFDHSLEPLKSLSKLKKIYTGNPKYKNDQKLKDQFNISLSIGEYEQLPLIHDGVEIL